MQWSVLRSNRIEQEAVSLKQYELWMGGGWKEGRIMIYVPNLRFIIRIVWINVLKVEYAFG